jgi:hypothetical protein
MSSMIVVNMNIVTKDIVANGICNYDSLQAMVNIMWTYGLAVM